MKVVDSPVRPKQVGAAVAVGRAHVTVLGETAALVAVDVGTVFELLDEGPKVLCYVVGQGLGKLA